MDSKNTGQSDLATVTSAWTSMTQRFLQSATAANRAAVSAMFPLAFDDRSNGDTTPPSVPSVEYSDLDWEFDRSVDDRAEIDVGDVVTFEKSLTEEDVQAFAESSGDTNRLHLDEDFASDTRFGGRIVHGTLVSGLISAALARLPGLTIYLSQNLEFCGPVAIGDRVSARVEVVEALGTDQYRLETTIYDEDEGALVVDGEAVVLIDDPPE